MKILKFFYAFLWLFVIPLIIGLSVEYYLIKIYRNYDENLLAGLVVCVLNSLAVTWIPGGFLIIEINIQKKHDLLILTLFLWVAGLVTPLLAGFQSFGAAVTVLFIFSALLPMEILKKEIRQISNHLKDLKYGE